MRLGFSSGGSAVEFGDGMGSRWQVRDMARVRIERGCRLRRRGMRQV